MKAPDELVTVGVLTKPHGIRGELRLHAFNLDSPLWDDVDRLVLREPSGLREVEVVSCRVVPSKHVVVRLAGVGTVEAADALRNVEVAVPRDALPALDEDEFYFVDLIGLPVLRDGAEVGRIENVLEYPSVDCLEIRCEDGVRELPILEPWVVSIDPDDGVVVGPWDDIPVR
ncbi:MAG: 16S rRNA processing protein RimM [Sandaracinus sp.]|nr:16S rRNA processing protein RimM [Myxococcales bacterium]MCB9615441.1 16S rRNA processing protein RimM [Sandaracinus sp.]